MPLLSDPYRPTMVSLTTRWYRQSWSRRRSCRNTWRRLCRLFRWPRWVVAGPLILHVGIWEEWNLGHRAVWCQVEFGRSGLLGRWAVWCTVEWEEWSVGAVGCLVLCGVWEEWSVGALRPAYLSGLSVIYPDRHPELWHSGDMVKLSDFFLLPLLKL